MQELGQGVRYDPVVHSGGEKPLLRAPGQVRPYFKAARPSREANWFSSMGGAYGLDVARARVDGSCGGSFSGAGWLAERVWHEPSTASLPSPTISATTCFAVAQLKVVDDAADLLKLFIELSALRSGTGKALLAWATDIAKKRGATRLTIKADADAAPFTAGWELTMLAKRRLAQCREGCCQN